MVEEQEKKKGKLYMLNKDDGDLDAAVDEIVEDIFKDSSDPETFKPR